MNISMQQFIDSSELQNRKKCQAELLKTCHGSSGWKMTYACLQKTTACENMKRWRINLLLDLEADLYRAIKGCTNFVRFIKHYKTKGSLPMLFQKL